jgi:hypothetical protein
LRRWQLLSTLSAKIVVVVDAADAVVVVEAAADAMADAVVHQLKLLQRKQNQQKQRANQLTRIGNSSRE